MKTWKKKVCNGSGQLGIAVVGDSAGAHFEIPEPYLNAKEWTSDTFKNILELASDEMDAPNKSGYTGQLPDDAQNPLRSIYKYMVDRNRCNRNDYQNIAVNGGASGNTQKNIKALRRDQKNDEPLLVFLELIGDDICNSKKGDFTEPDEFKTNVLSIFGYLDTVLPQGSHVYILGLVDGRILYDTLHNETHPLGITYSQVYDYLNCLGISPCFGWLNSDETERNKATDAANKLNDVYREIIQEGYQFNNFDYVYYDTPTQELIDRRIKEGGQAKDMIEPTDGFHPNQRFHAYLADWIWNTLETNHPDWIGEVNPNNALIDKHFPPEE